MRTLIAAAGSLTLTAALVVAPLVAAGAMASNDKGHGNDKDKDKAPSEVVAEWPADTVGEKGTLVPWSEASNGVAYWQDLYAAHDATCFKVDGSFSSSHGTVSADKLTVTLKPFQADWPGDHWEVLIIKAGSLWNSVIEHPQAGVAYASPPNNGGNQAQISHWIVCKGETPQTAPTLVTPDVELTLPTCEAEGTIEFIGDVNWDDEPNDDGTTTWIALPKAGTAFPEGTVNTWTVPTDLSKLAEGCDAAPPVKPEPLKSDKVKQVVDCDSDDVTITTIITTTDYVWDEESGRWVLGTPVDSEPVVTHRALTDAEEQACAPETTTETSEWKDGSWECGDTTVEQTRTVTTTVGDAEPTIVTETQTRDLTQAEIGECPLVPGDIESVCVGDVPYLGYAVTLPEGFMADSENPVTITFENPDGEDYVVAGQPLSGTLLWPGASAGEPKMWPGWELVDGEYVKTEGNFDWTRQGVTVRFDVNPTYSTEVDYPQAKALCANPASGGTTASANPLAATGGGVSPVVAIAGGSALAAGIAAVLIAVYRRRRAKA